MSKTLTSKILRSSKTALVLIGAVAMLQIGFADASFNATGLVPVADVSVPQGLPDGAPSPPLSLLWQQPPPAAAVGTVVWAPPMALRRFAGVATVGSNEADCTEKDATGTAVTANATRGFVAFTFAVPEAARYRVVIDVHASDSLANSVWAHLPPVLGGVEWGTLKTTGVVPDILAVADAASGSTQSCFPLRGDLAHTLRLFAREPGTAAARVRVFRPEPLRIVRVDGCTPSCRNTGGDRIVVTVAGLCDPSMVHAGLVRLNRDHACADLRRQSDTEVSCVVPAAAVADAAALEVSLSVPGVAPDGTVAPAESNAYLDTSVVASASLAVRPPEPFPVWVPLLIAGVVLVALGSTAYGLFVRPWLATRHAPSAADCASGAAGVSVVTLPAAEEVCGAFPAAREALTREFRARVAAEARAAGCYVARRQIGAFGFVVVARTPAALVRFGASLQHRMHAGGARALRGVAAAPDARQRSGGIAAQLQQSAGALATSVVTVLVVDTGVNLEDARAGIIFQATAAQLATLAERHGGHLHALEGPRLVFSFNAQRPLRGHARKAALAAADMSEGLYPRGASPSGAMATGLCTFGALGTGTHEVLCGPAVDAAHGLYEHLARYCRAFSTTSSLQRKQSSWLRRHGSGADADMDLLSDDGGDSVGGSLASSSDAEPAPTPLQHHPKPRVDGNGGGGAASRSMRALPALRRNQSIASSAGRKGMSADVRSGPRFVCNGAAYADLQQTVTVVIMDVDAHAIAEGAARAQQQAAGAAVTSPPTATSPTKPRPLHTTILLVGIVGRKETRDDDEWQYDLANAEAASPEYAVSEAFVALLRGKPDPATAVLAKYAAEGSLPPRNIRLSLLRLRGLVPPEEGAAGEPSWAAAESAVAEAAVSRPHAVSFDGEAK